jgi:hypothetical protein
MENTVVLIRKQLDGGHNRIIIHSDLEAFFTRVMAQRDIDKVSI